jgi:hypothetical protein
MNIERCRQLRAILDKTFADLESQMLALGVKVSVGKASYTPDSVGSASFKVEFAEIAADGNVATAESQAFKANAFIFGLKSEDLFRKFRNGGREFKIIGLKSRARTMPILCECEGKRFKFAAETVKALLATQAVA